MPRALTSSCVSCAAAVTEQQKLAQLAIASRQRRESQKQVSPADKERVRAAAERQVGALRRIAAERKEAQAVEEMLRVSDRTPGIVYVNEYCIEVDS